MYFPVCYQRQNKTLFFRYISGFFTLFSLLLFPSLCTERKKGSCNTLQLSEKICYGALIGSQYFKEVNKFAFELGIYVAWELTVPLVT